MAVLPPIPAVATVEEWRALWESERARATAAEAGATAAEARATAAEARATAAEEACVALRQEVEELGRQLRELKARLGQDSSNSSKPPSSDPPQAQGRREKRRSAFTKGGRRKAGGQKGHLGTTRAMVPADRVDRWEDHYPEQCKGCGAPVGPDQIRGKPVVRQEWELPPVQLEVIGHRYHSALCSCGCRTRAKVPPEGPVTLGVHLTAFIAVLVGEYRLSRRMVASLLQSLFGESFCTGAIQSCCLRVSRALRQPVDELVAALPGVATLFMDETGWRVSGVRHWLWCAVTSTFACFAIHRHRGREQVDQWFPEGLIGIVHSDRWSVYRWIDATRRQLCWAHLLRDLLAIVDAGFAGSARAKAIIEGAYAMFHEWHRYKEGQIEWDELRRLTAPFREALRAFCEAGVAQEATAPLEVDRRWRALSGQLIKLWPAVFNFLDMPGLEPTNNTAERALRGGVIWRRLTGGTRSEDGSLFVARFLTASATCRLQRRPLLAFVTDTLAAHRTATRSPSLLAA